jgi:hypothetical protein
MSQRLRWVLDIDIVAGCGETGEHSGHSLETVTADLRHQDALEIMTFAYIVIDDDTPMAMLLTTSA